MKYVYVLLSAVEGEYGEDGFKGEEELDYWEPVSKTGMSGL